MLCGVRVTVWLVKLVRYLLLNMGQYNPHFPFLQEIFALFLFTMFMFRHITQCSASLPT